MAQCLTNLLHISYFSIFVNMVTQTAEYGIAAHKISRHLAKGAPKLRVDR